MIFHFLRFRNACAGVLRETAETHGPGFLIPLPRAYGAPALRFRKQWQVVSHFLRFRNACAGVLGDR